MQERTVSASQTIEPEDEADGSRQSDAARPDADAFPAAVVSGPEQMIDDDGAYGNERPRKPAFVAADDENFSGV